MENLFVQLVARRLQHSHGGRMQHATVEAWVSPPRHCGYYGDNLEDTSDLIVKLTMRSPHRLQSSKTLYRNMSQ
jgi:hypothetical protein